MLRKSLNILIIGTEVGLLAQQRFPGGVDCTPEHHYDYAPALAATQAALAAGAPVRDCWAVTPEASRPVVRFSAALPTKTPAQ